MDSLVVLAVVAAIVGLCVVVVSVQVLWAFARWVRNSSQPRIDAPARVVAKREEVRTRGSLAHRVRTEYHATFELEDGRRFEFPLSGNQYGLLCEGDTGTLRHQGTWYLGFRR